MDRPMRPQPLIFVVHTELNVLMELEQIVEDGGYKATGCRLGADPYTMIVKFWPDLLIIDVSDQDPLALALLKKLDRDPTIRDLPIIAIATGYDKLTAFTARDAYRHRDAVVRTPVDSELLLALIDRMTQVFI